MVTRRTNLFVDKKSMYLRHLIKYFVAVASVVILPQQSISWTLMQIFIASPTKFLDAWANHNQNLLQKRPDCPVNKTKKVWSQIFIASQTTFLDT